MQLFRDFVFTSHCTSDYVVPMQWRYDADDCVFSATNFNSSLIRFPKGVTYMTLQLGVLGIDFDLGIYKLLLSDALIFVKSNSVTTFSLTFNILPETGLLRFAFMGITF